MESQGMSHEPFAGVAPGQKLRYVVLHHTGSGDGDHYDFMLEIPGNERLLTWRVPTAPQKWGGDVGAIRIADHRKAYLTYEGEISGNRGSVKRVDEGMAHVTSVDGNQLELALHDPPRTIRLALPAG
jgi:hypothetical protein